MDKNDTEQLVDYYLRAYKQGREYEYEYTFFECRKAAELILWMIGKREGVEFNTRERNIEKLIAAFNGELPKVVDASIRLIQSLGNYGSHHQHSREQETDKLFIDPCIAATRALITYLCPEIDLDSREREIDSVSNSTENLNEDSKIHLSGLSAGASSLRRELRRYVEATYSMSDEFRLGDLSRDFHLLHPAYSFNSVRTHTSFMTTNYPSRLSHRIKVDGSDDLLYRIDHGIYRRYNPETDPKPTYPDSED